MNDNKLMNRAADNIRILAASMVEKANSGHPGGAMGGADFVNVLFSEFLVYDPENPRWEGRDRFFLDPGHMSPMLYSTLALTGKFTLDELKEFRQWGSPTPGHPEVDIMRGIENTSGPLGQGHTFAVGAAIAAKFLKARFDEENNMSTAERMEQAGIRIIYSIPGLKVHAKVAVILRKDTSEGLKRRDFAYLSTGNFNEKTAKIYSDMALLTSNTEIITDINKVFAVLEGRMKEPTFRHLLVARFNMVSELTGRIRREIEHVREGRKGRIILKMNGLHDQHMIEELYHASEAGVEIDLIVRGICCLVPNQPYSANIRVTRIVDMFLEHSRVWYFLNDGQEDLFLTSADWMRRNLNRRIETAFPILDPDLKREIIDILNIQLSDNVKACYLDGELRNNFKCDDNPVKVRSQLAIYDYLRNKSIR